LERWSSGVLEKPGTQPKVLSFELPTLQYSITPRAAWLGQHGVRFEEIRMEGLQTHEQRPIQETHSFNAGGQ
jgi:hypothetical protein